MSLRMWLIILVLVAGNLFFGAKVVQVWSEGEKTLPVSGKNSRKPVLLKKSTPKRDLLPEAEYEVVVKTDLFRPNRAEPKTEKESAKPAKGNSPDEKLIKLLQSTVKRIDLYGVMIADGERKALIRNPWLPSQTLRERRSKRNPIAPDALKNKNNRISNEAVIWVKVGDPLNKFVVKEIGETVVTLEAEGLEFDVVLYDADKPKARGAAAVKGGAIVVDTKKGSGSPGSAEKSEKPGNETPVKRLSIPKGQKAPLQRQPKANGR